MLTTSSTPRGGVRPGAGRKTGVKNKPRLTLAQRAARHGPDALALLAAAVADTNGPLAVRVQAAGLILAHGAGPKEKAEAAPALQGVEG